MRALHLVLAAVFVAGCGDDGPEPEPSPTRVRIAQGELEGVVQGPAIAFKGIPYAAPPVGERRWRPPEPAAGWSGVRSADAFGPICAQDPRGGIPGQQSEDCLTVNVFVPRDRGDAALPVLFWIHGGAFSFGSASETFYEGHLLAAAAHSVVVTINYRLGAFGYLAHPALSAESGYGGSGNYAHMDQIFALRWVRDNIGSFGGDPSRVLVFGESAGGTSVSVLVASPLAAGLFSSALMLSGGPSTRSLADAESRGGVFAEAVECDGAADVLACMRGRSADFVIQHFAFEVAGGNTATTFRPVVDGYVLPRPQYDLFARGEHNRVPFALGTTREEFNEMYPAFFPDGIADWPALEAQLVEWWGAEVGAGFAAIYGPADHATPDAAMIAYLGDYEYVCPARKVARSVASRQPAVWRYLYTHTHSSGANAVDGAFHGGELAFLFRTYSAWDGLEPSGDELALADAMACYVRALAATGSTDGCPFAPWPAYDSARDNYLAWDVPPQTGSAFHAAACDFWDPILDALH